MADRRHRGVMSLVALVGLFRTVDGRAADDGLRFRWEAPSGCPDDADVHSDVERLAGSTAHVKPAIDARAVVERLGNGQWRVELETTKEGARGTRTLEAASCRALADSVSLILALMVQPTTGRSPPTPAATHPVPTKPHLQGPASTGPAPVPSRGAASRAPAPSRTAELAEPPPMAELAEPPPTAEPAEPPPSLPPPQSAEPARTLPPPPTLAVPNGAPVVPTVTTREAPDQPGTRPVLAIGVAATGARGVLPDFAWGGEVTAAWIRRHWRFQAAGEYLASQSHAVPGHPSIVGEYSGALGTIAACLEPGTRRLRGGVCLGIEGGGLHAVSSGVRSPGSARALWVATQLAAAVELLPTSRWGLRFELAAAAALRRPAFAIGGIGEVYEPSRLTIRGKIVAEMLF